MLKYYDHPTRLTTAQLKEIKSAFLFQEFPDGSFLLSIPSPKGYIYWHNEAADFISKGRELFTTLNISEATKC